MISGGCSPGKLFPGQYFDQETQLHYNYFRDYDASLGRYTTSDPIGLDAGINTYLYVENNPLAYFDLLGLAKCRCNATGGGVRDKSRLGTNGLGMKVCSYKCTCDMPNQCPDKIDLKLKYDAGTGGSVGCIGQFTYIPHWTQPGGIQEVRFERFSFDTESWTERANPFSKIPNGFISAVRSRL